VLTDLGHEHDGLDAADLHRGLVADLTEPWTLRSRSAKCLTHPVMWCVASLSRYHPSSLSSSEPSPRKARVHGSSMWSRAEEVSGCVE
jgi:hypothetical protein